MLSSRFSAMSFVIQSKMPHSKFGDSSSLFFCNVALLKEDKIGDKAKDREDVRIRKLIGFIGLIDFFVEHIKITCEL